MKPKIRVSLFYSPYLTFKKEVTFGATFNYSLSLGMIFFHAAICLKEAKPVSLPGKK